MVCKKGFSFIELLMGVFILFVVATSSLELFVAGARYSTHLREQGIASLLAQSKLESTLGMADTTSPDQAVEALVNQKIDRGNFDAPYADYKYTVEMLNDDFPMKTIQVTAVSPSGARATLMMLF